MAGKLRLQCQAEPDYYMQCCGWKDNAAKKLCNVLSTQVAPTIQLMMPCNMTAATAVAEPDALDTRCHMTCSTYTPELSLQNLSLLRASMARSLQLAYFLPVGVQLLLKPCVLMRQLLGNFQLGFSTSTLPVEQRLL